MKWLQIMIDKTCTYKFREPVSVAQSDARPTGDQEVAGSIPAGPGIILSWRLIMKYFLQSFSPFTLIEERQLSVSGTNTG